MNFYAELNRKNICFHILETTEFISDEKYIEIPDFSINYIGKKYINGEWIDNEEETTSPEPTQLDRIEEQQLILMEAQAEQYEQNIENRLNDMEVQATIYEAVLSLGGEK